MVLWSRLHLVTSSRRVLRWTLYLIIMDAIFLHSITTVLTFGSNSNSLSESTLNRFIHGYNIFEKIQMTGFFVQELILSIIYIKETIRLLRLSELAAKDDVASVLDEGSLDGRGVRKTMYQLIAINAIIIAMDIALLAVEFANLYLIETTLKGVVYSIKLKLEFAVLGKLVRLVRAKNSSGNRGSISSVERRGTSTGLALEKTHSGASIGRVNGNWGSSGGTQRFPDFVDPSMVSQDFTHAEPSPELQGSWEERDRGKRGNKLQQRGSWIDEEMVRPVPRSN